MTSASSSLILRNDSTGLLSIYIEPYPNDYWLQPGEAMRVAGSPGSGEVQVVRFDTGLTLWFGEDPDPEVSTLEGERLSSGHQRPE
jgi:hypothetical protein